MFLLKYQTPEQASEGVAKIYDHFTRKRSPVPAPLQLMSISPGLLKVFFEQITYFMNHEALSFPMLAAIRFLAAQEVCGNLHLRGTPGRRRGFLDRRPQPTKCT